MDNKRPSVPSNLEYSATKQAMYHDRQSRPRVSGRGKRLDQKRARKRLLSSQETDGVDKRKHADQIQTRIEPPGNEHTEMEDGTQSQNIAPKTDESLQVDTSETESENADLKSPENTQ
ncbi:hypothetical protein RF11_07679 [Thelohanellus kitauei]|uniref:Uncharacterized protein n=1 Tax=Thelohanellus kitauei TaxID=669202 RepID=A0A0C2IPF6_THEKT|nr:hypothetical protein RF11_07679 [Thelohanellus kitauei]